MSRRVCMESALTSVGFLLKHHLWRTVLCLLYHIVPLLYSSSHLLSPFVLVMFPLTLVKYPEQKLLGENGFMLLTVPGYSPSLLGCHCSKQGLETTNCVHSEDVERHGLVDACLSSAPSILPWFSVSCLENGATHIG